LNKRIYDLTTSIKLFLDGEGYKTDIVYDGYEYPKERPLITIEQMPSNLEYIVKGREAVEVINRWQIGLHASNQVERMKHQELITELLTFKKIPYYEIDKSISEAIGFFNVEITGVTPMPSDDLAKHSVRYTVYFDVELLTVKRSC